VQEEQGKAQKLSLKGCRVAITLKVMKLQKLFLRERRVCSEATKVVPKGAQSKFRSSKVVPKGMQSQNTTKIEGEEAQKMFLRECRA
jgi:hypothetical protein